MSKGFKQMKEMFDKMDQKEDPSDDEYKDIEGENLVIRNQKQNIRKNLKIADKVKENLKKYEGKNISYSKIKKMQEDDDEDIDEEDDEEINSDDIGDDNEEESEEEENNEEKEEEEEEEEEGGNENNESHSEENGTENDNKEEEDNDSEIEEKKVNNKENNKPTKEEMDKEDDEYLKKLTKSTPNEIKKAKNVLEQKNIYDFFIGFRISLQSLLTSINSLPSYHNFQDFLSQSDENTQATYLQIKSSLLTLLENMLTIHKKLILKSNIPSIEGFDPITEINDIIKDLSEETQNDSYDNLITFHNKLNQINEKVINIWYRKSLVNSFRTNNKIIKVLNDDYSQHILRNITNNYSSLRKNTRKTNNEKLLGRKRENEEDFDFDEEIYNDIDFYNFLLKEFLLSNEKELDKQYSNDNRYDLTMKYLMNKASKLKKNVDTRASKNRKIRYDKHEKIINFMVPQINMKEAVGRNIIVNSLFGMQKKIEKENNKEEEENDVDLI